MSDKYQALRRAAELLREGAEELKIGHCKNGPRWLDWTGEPEAKAAYDEAMSVADDLDLIQAQVEQLRTEAKVASDRIQELGWFTKAQRGEIEGLRADLSRTERNRDMWKEQCARQAEQLETGILHLNAEQAQVEGLRADAQRLQQLLDLAQAQLVCLRLRVGETLPANEATIHDAIMQKIDSARAGREGGNG